MSLAQLQALPPEWPGLHAGLHSQYGFVAFMSMQERSNSKAALCLIGQAWSSKQGMVIPEQAVAEAARYCSNQLEHVNQEQQGHLSRLTVVKLS